jgi:hypothetical protein
MPCLALPCLALIPVLRWRACVCFFVPGEESAPEEEAQDESGANPPVATTISLDALLRACGNYAYSFKTKMSLEEVYVVKAAVSKCSEESGSSEWLASAFLEALLLEGKDKVLADVCALWSTILNPLILAVSEDTPEGKYISEAVFKARRSAQNWSKATGLTQSEMAVILEAFESLDPNTWYQGGSVGKKELHKFEHTHPLAVSTHSSWADILYCATEDDEPILFSEFLEARSKVVHSAQYGLLQSEIALVAAAFKQVSSNGFGNLCVCVCVFD